jgi:putative membrane-bound dehydrogenase-like protein
MAPLCAALFLPPVAKAAGPVVTAADLPRIPAVEPKDAVKTFQVKPGFHMELVASEPLVVSPVAMSFDERGRLFVVEMIDYSERRDESPHLGRIRMLEDTNGDGIFDKSTVYADNLAWPTALFCYDGGLFVGATPDIIYLKDTRGDGKADLRETVFTGFAEGMKRVNVQGMLNSFNWGLDNRIHGATSTDGGLIRQLRHPEIKPLDLHGRDFVIEPRTMTMTSEAGGGQHGLSFDDWGRRFACNNSDHIRLFMYDDRYAGRNPFYAMPGALAGIAVDGGAAEVYRISPEEPWRVIRTRWRIAGLVSGPVEGGGRSAGYFTGATGNTIYRGNAFPKEYLDNAFVGDAGGNLVHRKVLLPDDVGLKAQRPADEQNVEFVASKDTWFRPVQFANAPDGTLYVIDMYRETIEHPWSLPDNIKKFVDLNSGNDRGRIYRIVPDGFQQPKLPRLDRANVKELVSTLENPNGWHRDTASRLLFERQDKSAVPALVKLLEKSKSPLGRLHALYALDGLDSLKEEHVLAGLNDSEPGVRGHAVKLSGKLIKDSIISKRLWAKLHAMAADPSLNVRYQLAFTLGELKNGARIESLASILKQDVASPWVQAAALSSLSEGAGELFGDLAADGSFGKEKSGQEFLRQLASLVGAKNNPKEVAQVLAFVSKAGNPALTFSMVRSLGDGLQKAGSSLEKIDTQGALKTIFANATRVASDEKAEAAVRTEAIQLLAFTSYKESGELLLHLLDKNQPQSVQMASVATLAKFNDAEVATGLIKHWHDSTPRVKSELMSVMLGRPERATVLLNSISDGSMQPGDLTTAQIKFLRNHHDAGVHKLAATVFANLKEKKRQDVIDAYQSALNLTGDAAKGKKIYLQRCSSCHRLGGNGFQLGPDLVTVKNTGKEKMLVNILDPNREVAPVYIAFQIDTKDDESLVGVIANETTSSITVRQAFGKEDTLMRSKLKRMQSQGQSLMPEGLEEGLKPQDFANLLEYISTADAGK